MVYTDWLRLKVEGKNVCSILRQQGYQCRKQVRCLSWKFTKDGVSFCLTWLPQPVGDWSLIPKVEQSEWYQLNQLVSAALVGYRGGGR